MGLLYVSQYLGIGFLFYGATSILRAQGADLGSLAIVQSLALFWAVKFLWSPVIDRFGGRRLGHYRAWLLTAAQKLGYLPVMAGVIVVYAVGVAVTYRHQRRHDTSLLNQPDPGEVAGVASVL